MVTRKALQAHHNPQRPALLKTDFRDAIFYAAEGMKVWVMFTRDRKGNDGAMLRHDQPPTQFTDLVISCRGRGWCVSGGNGADGGDVYETALDLQDALLKALDPTWRPFTGTSLPGSSLTSQGHS